MNLGVTRSVLALALVAPLACGEDGSGPRGPLALDITSAPDSLLRSEHPRVTGGVIDADGNAVRGHAVTYRSLDESVLRVDARGRLTAEGLGSTRVIVASGELADTTDAITVYATYQLELVDEDVISLDQGATRQLSATMLDDMDNVVTGYALDWSSSDARVASVSGAGEVTAIAAGAAWARVTSLAPDGTLTGDSVPVEVLVRYASIAAGFENTCALTVEGEAYCWGTGRYGELGGGEFRSSTQPVRVVGGRRFSQIAPGGDFTCAIERQDDGSGPLFCWGDNPRGELGIGTTGDSSAVPLAVDSNLEFTQVSTGGAIACAVAVGGDVYCWGDFFARSLGPDVDTRTIRPTRVAIPAPAVSVSAGAHWSACAVVTDGRTYCWSYNDWYQLARPERRIDLMPDTIVGGHRLEAVTVGWFHSCGLRGDGVALCWGEDEPLADTSAAYVLRYTPEPIHSDLRFTQLSARSISTCGLTASGQAYCWGGGSGSAGRGHVGVATNRPTVVTGGPPLTTLSAGQWHACGMGTDGRAWCWGRSANGAFGAPPPTTRNEMMRIPFQQ